MDLEKANQHLSAVLELCDKAKNDGKVKKEPAKRGRKPKTQSLTQPQPKP